MKTNIQYIKTLFLFLFWGITSTMVAQCETTTEAKDYDEFVKLIDNAFAGLILALFKYSPV